MLDVLPMERAQSPSTSGPPSTPSRTRTISNAHRLLYRGALSLPDSDLLLDGLSFVAETRNGFTPSSKLMQDPFALSLESMRGRPSLRLLGTEKLEHIRLDTESQVNVYIHPQSLLSHLFFENALCLAPVTSPDGRTDEGVRIGIGESDEPEETDFFVFGQLTPDDSKPSTSSSSTKTLQILAARIQPKEVVQEKRKPRPDDPTPRRPSAYYVEEDASVALKRKRGVSMSSLTFGGGKKSKAVEEDEQVKRAREVMLHMPKPSRASQKEKVPVFKVPQLPARLSSPEEDVFGSGGTSDEARSKRDKPQQPGFDELEKANRTVIKQATVTFLGHRGIKKADPEFTDFYQTIYRGVAFALRAVMRTQAVKLNAVEKLCHAHWRLYTEGNGESSSR